MISGATAFAVVLTAFGWWNRDESNLVAEEGTGYWLGVFGLTCMTALLLYSLRKRIRGLRGAGRISSWFQIHMLLGLAGPVAILHHCNFRWGSMNSNVALVCALVVAASGIIGRLIYTRIHHGLSSRRTTLAEIRSEVDEARTAIEGDARLRALWDELEGLERRVSGGTRSAVQRIATHVTIGHACRRARRRALRRIRGLERSDPRIVGDGHALRSAVSRYVSAVRRTVMLDVYERVFALWHVLHLPLALLLYVSAAVHVVAVNVF